MKTLLLTVSSFASTPYCLIVFLLSAFLSSKPFRNNWMPCEIIDHYFPIFFVEIQLNKEFLKKNTTAWAPKLLYWPFKWPEYISGIISSIFIGLFSWAINNVLYWHKTNNKKHLNIQLSEHLNIVKTLKYSAVKTLKYSVAKTLKYSAVTMLLYIFSNQAKNEKNTKIANTFFWFLNHHDLMKIAYII